MIYVCAALLTAILETTFFGVCRYRKKGFLAYVFGINMLTNFVVNQVWIATYPIFPYHRYFLIFLLETGVLISEYGLIALYLQRTDRRLWGLVFCANLMTWGLGEVLTLLLANVS